jgi:hypothetical protein
MKVGTQTSIEFPAILSSQNCLTQREEVGYTPRGEVLGVPM